MQSKDIGRFVSSTAQTAALIGVLFGCLVLLSGPVLSNIQRHDWLTAGIFAAPVIALAWLGLRATNRQKEKEAEQERDRVAQGRPRPPRVYDPYTPLTPEEQAASNAQWLSWKKAHPTASKVIKWSGVPIFVGLQMLWIWPIFLSH
jgi:hypothetical protein